MIGKQPAQSDLFDVGNVFELRLDPKSFHGQLADAAPRLFRDEDFAALYHPRLGRPSTPPSQLALLLLLQHEAGVSDAEAVARSAYDLRWAAVLRRPAGEALCAKSTLQLFRAHLVLHERVRTVFQASLEEGRRKGLLKRGPLQVTIDTMPLIGAGAVKDTFNLLAAGIWRVVYTLSQIKGERPEQFAARHELTRYLPNPHRSLKGECDIDWSDEAARAEVLTRITRDALRTWKLAQAAVARCTPAQASSLREAQLLLGDLLLQDVEIRQDAEGDERAHVKEGTAPDRIPSATDPEQRHGHKSQANRFTGHKSRTAVDVETGLILDVEVRPGNAADATELKAQVERVEATTGDTVTTVYGDCAFGNGSTRAELTEAGKELVAKVPTASPQQTYFPKSRFTIDLEAGTVTCPAGRTTDRCSQSKDGTRIFRFGKQCATCPLREQCTASAAGRTVQVHPQEALLQAAREFQNTAEGRRRLRLRLKAEHRQARLAQLGAKRARYCGRAKSLVQLLLAATVANLRWTWNWAQRQERAGGGNGPESPGWERVWRHWGAILTRRWQRARWAWQQERCRVGATCRANSG